MPIDLAAVRPALLALQGWAQEQGVPRQAAQHMALALDELITNTIEHGHPPGADGSVDLLARVSQRCLQVVVRDHGLPYDPLQAPTPDLLADIDKRRVGGLGVHFARTLTDEMEHRLVEGDGAPINEVTLTKRF